MAEDDLQNSVPSTSDSGSMSPPAGSASEGAEAQDGAGTRRRLKSLQGGRRPASLGLRTRPDLKVIHGERRSDPAPTAPCADDRYPAFRYRRPDMLSQIPRALGTLAFGAATLAVLYYGQGQPRPFGLVSFLNLYRFSAGPTETDTAAYLAGLASVLSGTGLLISRRRMRRQEDRYGRISIAIFILSGLAVVAYVARVLPR